MERLAALDLPSLAALYGEGHTIHELALRLRCADETVRRALVRAGIARRPRGRPPGKFRPSGGLIRDKDGYLLVRAPQHPSANASGYVRQHRLVMEGQLGRLLKREEVVHHINRIKDDNRPENLQLYESTAAHKREDMRGNSWAKGDFGNPRRRFRRMRSPEQILQELYALTTQLGRPIQRKDLVPPNPSHRAVARAFGSWQEGVRLAFALRGAPFLDLLMEFLSGKAEAA